MEKLKVNELRDLLRKRNLKVTGNKDVLIQRLREYSNFSDLPSEMIQTILSNMDDKELLRLCSVDRRVNKICSDDVFWKSRLTTNFPAFNIEEYNETTYRKLYEIFVKRIADRFGLVEDVTMRDSINMLNTIISGLEENDIESFYEYILTEAAEHGKPNLVKYILENNLVDITQQQDPEYMSILEGNAIATGNLDIIKSMIDYDITDPIVAISRTEETPELPNFTQFIEYLYTRVDPDHPRMEVELEDNIDSGIKYKERVKVIIDNIGKAGLGDIRTIMYALNKSIKIEDQDIFDYIVKAQKRYPQFRLDKTV